MPKAIISYKKLKEPKLMEKASMDMMVCLEKSVQLTGGSFFGKVISGGKIIGI